MGKCDLNKDGLHLPEKSNMCCFLIPIKIGVMVIALLVILIGIQAIVYLYNYFDDHKNWNGDYDFNGSEVGWIICILPLVYAAVLVVLFFLKKSKSKMITACQAVLVAELMTGIWFLIDYYIINKDAFHQWHTKNIID